MDTTLISSNLLISLPSEVKTFYHGCPQLKFAVNPRYNWSKG